jgi:hypothetical protein
MLNILQRVQRQHDALGHSSSSEDEEGDGAEESCCELSEATLTKLLLRVRQRALTC